MSDISEILKKRREERKSGIKKENTSKEIFSSSSLLSEQDKENKKTPLLGSILKEEEKPKPKLTSLDQLKTPQPLTPVNATEKTTGVGALSSLITKPVQSARSKAASEAFAKTVSDWKAYNVNIAARVPTREEDVKASDIYRFGGDFSLGILRNAGYAGEMIFNPALAALFPEGPKEGSSTETALNNIEKAFEYMGEGLNDFVTKTSGFLVGTAKIPEALREGDIGIVGRAMKTTSPDAFQEKTIKEVGADVVLGAAFPVAGYGLKQSIKGVSTIGKSIAATSVPKLFKSSAEDKLNSLNRVLEEVKRDNLISVDENGLKEDFLAIENAFNNGVAKSTDIEGFVSKYSLSKKTASDYFKRLEEANSFKTLTKKIQSQVTSSVVTAIKSNKFNKIKNRLTELGYVVSKPSKKNGEILNQVRKEFNKSDVNRTAKFLREDSDESVIETIKLYNDTKNTNKPGSEAIYDDEYNLIKANTLLDAIERGLIIKSGESYKYTAKAIDIIKRQSPEIKSDELKIISENPITEIPEDIYRIAKAKRDGDIFPISEANRLYEELKGSVEISRMRELLLMKQTGKGYPAIDSDIVALAQKANSRFGVNFKIDELYDRVTGVINPDKLDEFIDALNDVKSKSFIQYKNLKMPGKGKNLKQELGIQEKLFNEIYAQGAKVAKQKTKAEYELKIKTLKEEYNKKITLLKEKNKDNVNQFKIDRKIERIKYNEEKYTLLAATKDIRAIKVNILDDIGSLADEGYSPEDVLNIKRDFRDSNAYKNADINSPESVSSMLSELNKIIVEVRANRVHKSIMRIFKNVKKAGRSSAKAKRLKYDTYTRKKLLELKALYSNVIGGKLDANKFDLEWAEQLLEDLSKVESKSREKMKKLILQRKVDNNQALAQIEKEGVNKIEGYGDITRRTSTGKKVLMTLRSMKTGVTYIDKVFRDIFGENSLGSKLYKKGRGAIDESNKFYSTQIEPIITKLVELNGYEAGYDYMPMFYALQRGGSNDPFFGINHVKSSPTFAEYLERIDEVIDYEDMPKNLPFTREAWESLNNTKLQKLFKDKAEAKEFIETRRALNEINEIIHPRVNEVAIRTEGVEIDKFDDYLSIVTLRRNKKDLDYDAQKFMQSKVSDSFTNGRKGVAKGESNEYFENLFDLMDSSIKRQVKYIYIKEIFEDIRDIFKGTMFRFDDTDNAADMLSSGKYNLVDADGNSVEYSVDIDNRVVNVLTDKGGKEILTPDSDFYLRSKKGGIVDIAGNTGGAFLETWLDDLSRGGPSAPISDKALRGTGNVVGKFAGFVSKNALMFNVMSLGVQFASLVDSFGTFNPLELGKAIRTVTTNKAVRRELFKVPSVQQRAANPYLKDISRKFNKGIIVDTYAKYEEAGLWGLKNVDRELYAALFHAAYVKELKKLGLKFDGKYDKIELVENAATEIDSLMGTANDIALPQALKNPFGKAFFGLFTTQLARVQRTIDGIEKIFTGKNTAERIAGFRKASFMLAGSYTDIMIRYYIGKALYEAGLSTYDGYEDTLGEELMKLQHLYRNTLGQTYLGNLVGSQYEGFDPFVAISGVKNVSQAAITTAMVLSAQEEPDALLNAIRKIFGGKLDDYIINLEGAGNIPEGSTMGLIGAGIVGLAGAKILSSRAPKSLLNDTPEPPTSGEGTTKIVAGVSTSYRNRYGYKSEPEIKKEIEANVSKKVADLYEKAENDFSPRVLKAYADLRDEVFKQYEEMKRAGIKIIFTTDDPYKTSKEMIDDIVKNKQIRVFKTSEGSLPEGHPLGELVTIDGEEVMYNDIFRGVHDFFGHAEYKNGFGAIGEDNAWRVHSSMLSDNARRALTTETKGQNSWVNFNKDLRNEDGSIKKKGDPGYVPPSERPFAEQKTFLFDDDIVFADGNIKSK